MRKSLFLMAIALLSATFVSAQNYMVVNSEKVFKSLTSYNNALETLDDLAESYQNTVDQKFAAVEQMYNSYMQQRASLSESYRQQREKAILDAEAEATEYQEKIFGTDGTLMQKRLELIQPIQDKVFKTIESYAKRYGYDLVIDSASNPTLLYNSEKVDFTDRIIEALRY
ncbi:MAG: OmpH family outer membrane protein [Alistipes sp.]|nr:OmpH family outer membrane protein [Alistipes sp.]MBQ8775041.1 OmpH family outer membrane protein [Alistipes sp.]